MRRACRGNLPTADEIRNPEYWRGRAGKVRAVADSLRDPASRRTMLGIAASYDALAQSAERRIETWRYSRNLDTVCPFWMEPTLSETFAGSHARQTTTR